MSRKTYVSHRSAWLGRTAMAAVIAAGAFAAPALAQDVKIGALFGVTGPLANYIPPIQSGAELAVKPGEMLDLMKVLDAATVYLDSGRVEPIG